MKKYLNRYSAIIAATLYLSLMFLPIAPLAFVGCASANRTAYQTVGVTQITVDAAMTAWGSYVGTGKATVTQEQQVKDAFKKYQLSAVLVIDAAKASNNADEPVIKNAIAAASASLGNLVNLIRSFGVKL